MVLPLLGGEWVWGKRRLLVFSQALVPKAHARAEDDSGVLMRLPIRKVFALRVGCLCYTLLSG